MSVGAAAGQGARPQAHPALDDAVAELRSSHAARIWPGGPSAPTTKRDRLAALPEAVPATLLMSSRRETRQRRRSTGWQAPSRSPRGRARCGRNSRLRGSQPLAISLMAGQLKTIPRGNGCSTWLAELGPRLTAWLSWLPRNVSGRRGVDLLPTGSPPMTSSTCSATLAGPGTTIEIYAVPALTVFASLGAPEASREARQRAPDNPGPGHGTELDLIRRYAQETRCRRAGDRPSRHCRLHLLHYYQHTAAHRQYSR